MINEPIYHIHELQKEYAGRIVLSIEKLEVNKSEILAFIGPSGAGKSTFLRLLNFLEQPSQGWLKFEGVRFDPGSEMPLEYRRRVTTVFQRPMLLNRNIWHNVTFGLRLRGQHNSQNSVQAALEQVGLGSLVNQNARALSGGEAQRVALARAIILHPDVLLLDEPTANLDPYNVGLIENIIREVNHDLGTTIVLITHNVFQARRLANRTAFILAGKLIEIAETQQLFQSPIDDRTRGFINGEMVY